MSKRDDAKIRLLLIERMLSYDKVISAAEIIRRLEPRGIYADRKTIYDDMAAINKIMPLESKPGYGGGFYRVDVVRRIDEEGV